ncbi:MAG: hypothetical protein JO270_11530 [Acidobacteriaceae bacterium]|nr:hypothetical protein [Acidobacteriaceae bacterium]
MAIMRPEAHARAIAAVVGDLVDTREGATYFAEMISGIGLHYNLGGNHTLIGRSAPDFEFEDGTRLGTLLHNGKALLLEISESEKLRVLSEARKPKLTYVSAKAKDTQGLAALFIRPDGFVAWASESDPDFGDADAAVARWLGNAA